MIQPEMHLHCAHTSPVMSKAMPGLASSCCYSLQLHQCLYVTVSSALLTSSKLLRPKNMVWLTSDQEEQSHCGQGIISTTQTTLCPEQLWTLLIQHYTKAVEGFCFFYYLTMFGVKYFDIITFAIIPAPVGAEPRPGPRNWDRKNKERAGKNTQRGCFESPNRLLPSIFRGWNFSLTVRRNLNLWSSCPQLARVGKPPPHTFARPSPPQIPLSHLSQPGNQWETQTRHGSYRDQHWQSCCDM